jgi:hypothetical protein
MNRSVLTGKQTQITRQIKGLLGKSMSFVKLVKDINVRLSDILN